MRYLNYQELLNKLRFSQIVFTVCFILPHLVDGIDYESIVIESLKANPELKAHYNHYIASQKVMIQVRALPEPRLTYTRFLSKVQTRTGPQERILQLSQPFPWPGKLALRGGIANREAEVAFHQYEALQREVMTRIADSYYDYVILGESIDITRQTVSYIEQLLPVVEEKVRGGGRLADTLILEIEKEKTEDEINGFYDRRPILSSQLEAEMGREADLKKPLPFPYFSKSGISLPPIGLLEDRLDCHPRITAASSKILSFELKKKLAEKARLPDMSLGASVIDIGNGGDTAAGVVLGFNVPIRHHKYHAEVEQAGLEKSASIQLRTNIKNNLRSQLHREYQMVKDAQRRSNLYKDKLIPKAEQTLAQLEDSYRGNKTPIDEIINAEKLLLQLRLECLKSTAQAHKRAVYLRVLTEPVTRKGIQAVPVESSLE